MAATDHTRLRTSGSTARNESTDKRRIVAVGNGAAGLSTGKSGPATVPNTVVRVSETPGVSGRLFGSRRKTDEDRTVARAFGATLREARRARGMTQEELAAAAGMDRTYPSLLENGKREPALGVFYRLCKALRCAPAELQARTLARLLPVFLAECTLPLPELTVCALATATPPQARITHRAHNGPRQLRAS